MKHLTRYNGIHVVAPTPDTFMVRLGDGLTLHIVPRRHILMQHLIAGSAINLVKDIFAQVGNDAQRATDKRIFEDAPMVAGPYAPANYRTLPDKSRHLCIMVDGVPQWHHCPAPSRLNALIAETATLSPAVAAEQVLCRLDEAPAVFDATVLRAMKRPEAA